MYNINYYLIDPIERHNVNIGSITVTDEVTLMTQPEAWKWLVREMTYKKTT